MIYGTTNNELETSIESYANQLSWYMHWYLDKTTNTAFIYSNKATEKAKIVLRWTIFPNEKEFKKDYESIKSKVGFKTNLIIREYTKCIMNLLGQVAECIIVDKCASNPDLNKICINIAKFKPDIYEEYTDIPYDEYLAFSTSFKYVIYKDPSTGIYLRYNIPDYNPNHTSKDIAWFKKDNILDQLKADISALNYLENAKLQIKTTLNSGNLDLSNYLFTPVVCFDLCNDFIKAKERYPNNILFSMREIRPEIEIEIEKYFRILGAYATGLIDHINITDIDVKQDLRLAELFRTPIGCIVNDYELNTTGLVEMAEKIKKPIIING